jgi:hypothetical protein
MFLMTQPMGMADFFAMEAGEYLERLDGLASPAASPDFQEFHRIARALRGSALMASQQQIAAVAGGLEALARAARDGTATWDEAHRQLAIRAVDDLKVLVRAINSWTDAETVRAQRIASELEQVTGATTPPESQPQQLDAATRAFIAREGAAVGSALDQAARTLARNPMGVSSLDAVLRATQPLRGIASLSDLPPLPDLLDGIERAVREMMRRTEPMPNPGDVFDAAAKAICRVSREIATTGDADPDAPEVGEFARLLGGLLEMGPDIIPIEALYHADGGPHVLSEGAAPTLGEAPGQLEMVSLGEHLKQAAEDLEGARSNPQRQLRAHGLAPTLRTLEGAGRGTAKLAHALRNAIGGGAAVTDTPALAAALREAGAILSGWGEEDTAVIEERLQPVSVTIRGLGEQPVVEVPVPPTPTPTPMPAAVVEPVAPAEPEAARAAVEPATPEQPSGDDWLAASFADYDHLLAAGSVGTPLAELFEQPVDAPAPGPADLPAHPASAEEVGWVTQSDEEIAPITDYCFTGAAALKQAMALKKKLQIGVPVDRQELLEEIFDLVELGLRQTT